MKRRKLNKKELLERLESIKYVGRDDRVRDEFERLSLADALLVLAELNHDKEYQLCRSLALHLLGHVPEPEVDLDESI